MILPIKVDAPLRHRPTVNYLLIAVNALLFIFTTYGNSPLAAYIRNDWSLNVGSPKLYQFLTYAFLHADWTHLIGNMLFLYIFGNSLNDKLGTLQYTLFYLASAIFAGAGYALMTPNPTQLVGASGAIASVTTAFLVLFPRSNVTVVVWFFYFIDTFEFSSLFLIIFKMILLDNVIFPAISGPSRVAHGAHLVGYLFGVVVPLILLATKSLDRDQFDILALWSRIIRRRQYSRVVELGRSPFGETTPVARPAQSTVINTSASSADVGDLRKKITDALARYDLTTAAEGYRQLIQADPHQMLSRRDQLDVANQLMSMQDYATAADAYEKYLASYPTAHQIEQVQLLLGIIYSRYLPNPDRAKTLLTQAKSRLRDRNQVTLCEEELRRLCG